MTTIASSVCPLCKPKADFHKIKVTQLLNLLFFTYSLTSFCLTSFALFAIDRLHFLTPVLLGLRNVLN